jgi:molybdopterin molybdotransferase
MDFKNVVTMDKGIEILNKNLNMLLALEMVSIEESIGRIIAEDIYSSEDVPHYSRSTVDGYGVISEDTFGASESAPAYFKLAEAIQIGHDASTSLNPGEASAIPTGGMLPPRADGVVMVEYTEVMGDQVIVYKGIGPGENVIFQGEDIKKGELIFSKGHRIRFQDLGALASVGITRIGVFEEPTVGIISTGDELVHPNTPLSGGQIRDINTYTLIGLIKKLGGIPISYGIVPDNRDVLKKVVKESLMNCHITLISGGSSVGVRDFTPEVINSLGSPGVLTHGLSIKPGKPTIVAVVEGKPIIGLPGHPVSSLVVAETFLTEIFDALCNSKSKTRPKITGVLSKNIHSAPGRRDYIRVKVIKNDDGVFIDPILGKSGLITTMTKAEGLLIIPEDINGYQKGSHVEVILW